jgi:hypothetical protein
MVTLTAKELTINDVHQLLKWNKQSNNSFSSLLLLTILLSTSTRLKVGWALPSKSLKILSRDGRRQCPPYSSIL